MQNIVSLNLTDAQLTEIDGALTTLETQLASLIALETSRKLSLRKMGPKSEAFCRQTLRVLEQNPQIVPPNMSVADAVADLTAQERLRPRLVRLSRLSARASDTDMALGSDVMSTALQGYGLLKLVGRTEGLEILRKDLSNHFAKSARKPNESNVVTLPAKAA
jgi:hypothetical protein